MDTSTKRAVAVLGLVAAWMGIAGVALVTAPVEGDGSGLWAALFPLCAAIGILATALAVFWVRPAWWMPIILLGQLAVGSFVVDYAWIYHVAASQEHHRRTGTPAGEFAGVMDVAMLLLLPVYVALMLGAGGIVGGVVRGVVARRRQAAGIRR